MKMNWENPELTNLSVSKTNEETATPFFYWPNAPKCKNPVNTGKKCNKPLRACQYSTPHWAEGKTWLDCTYVDVVVDPETPPSGS